MTRRPIDQHAVRIPQASGLLPCLYIPVAARDADAIETYVGRIVAPLSRRSPDRALLVEAHEPEEPDGRLAIWGYPNRPSYTTRGRSGWMSITALTGALTCGRSRTST
jgi:hypothetical protein